MKLLQTLYLSREDIGEQYKNTLIEYIEISMFPFFNTGVMLHEDLILFIDNDGTTKILKNRFGKTSNN